MCNSVKMRTEEEKGCSLESPPPQGSSPVQGWARLGEGRKGPAASHLPTAQRGRGRRGHTWPVVVCLSWGGRRGQHMKLYDPSHDPLPGPQCSCRKALTEQIPEPWLRSSNQECPTLPGYNLWLGTQAPQLPSRV